MSPFGPVLGLTPAASQTGTDRFGSLRNHALASRIGHVRGLTPAMSGRDRR